MWFVRAALACMTFNLLACNGSTNSEANNLGGTIAQGTGGASLGRGGAVPSTGSSGGTITTGGRSSPGGTAASGGTTAATTGGPASGERSAGCGKSAPLPTATKQTTSVGGTPRSYYLVPPTGYNAATAYPLVFVFHGAGGTGEGMHGWFKLEQAASGAALFIYPDGLGGIWDLGNNGPDAKLFDQLVGSLGEGWCLDTKAIFAVGFSYGGWAATQMALSRPTVIRAIASLAGGGPQGGKNTDPAVAAMIIHGTADTAEPIVAGTRSRDHFVATNGCAKGTSNMSPSPCVAYVGCQAGKSVAWCEHTGAHDIPDFAASGIWSFFLANR